MSNINANINLLNPPVVLVQTWCLLSRDEDEEVSHQGRSDNQYFFRLLVLSVDFLIASDPTEHLLFKGDR